MVRIIGLGRLTWVIALLVGSPAVAQLRQGQAARVPADSPDGEQPAQQQSLPTPFETNQAGRTARSSVGQVGQRQTGETDAESVGLNPMGRLSTRVQNRVQNRIHNRIDRNYDPQQNAAAPFAVAEDRSRTGQLRR